LPFNIKIKKTEETCEDEEISREEETSFPDASIEILSPTPKKTRNEKRREREK
jgi:hypothetical protein